MDIISVVIGFLVMLNPFALFLYLKPVMQDLSDQHFLKVFFRATLISFFVFLFFLLLGDFIFKKVFQIYFESFRIFGGVILFSFAYLFIVKGQRGFIQIKEDLDDLASEIALPFMVGAGTISLSILMGDQLMFYESILSLVIIMIVNFTFVIGLKEMRQRITSRKLKVAFDKNLDILTRINGFFVGAIGVDMVIRGIENLIQRS
ncbi:multiple antibiotic resistance protein [Catalinimonas alkaloidigena]|uniref:MarC family protein n=1 Tax=Catalinimonas alkaloidigena TaxID=1075417 RepID=UPI002406F8AD|nr:MarC family protein [Catalinimonas alkaloidigena]MDF9796026.1 multiple antibiotic resistance protein [Catalinimonas alkaloidigena]